MKNKLLSFLLCIVFSSSYAQEYELLDSLIDHSNPTQKVSNAFKSTRVIHAHSIEMLEKGNLDFRIMHRFGFVSDGLKEFFGLDEASMRMSFDYGISNNISMGIGRSTFRKELDAFFKARLMQQAIGSKGKPISVVLAIGGMTYTEKSFAPIKPNFAKRSAYYFQLLAGKKVSEKFSAQISPMVLHTVLPVVTNKTKTLWAMGAGVRYKISKHIALTFDYHLPFGYADSTYENPLAVGVDIETGGHVFQLQFSNATGMNERAYLTETTGNFFKGDIRFGFNLSRMFQVKKR